MIHTKNGLRCEKCFREDDKALQRRRAPYAQDASERMLRALGLGPRNLKQLAVAIYGSDDSSTRRRTSSLLKAMKPEVEPVDPGSNSGVWRLAHQKPEAAV